MEKTSIEIGKVSSYMLWKFFVAWLNQKNVVIHINNLVVNVKDN